MNLIRFTREGVFLYYMKLNSDSVCVHVCVWGVLLLVFHWKKIFEKNNRTSVGKGTIDTFIPVFTKFTLARNSYPKVNL